MILRSFNCDNVLSGSFLCCTSEEVLFENVELILEAFDYLQLPVALKRGNFKLGFACLAVPF